MIIKNVKRVKQFGTFKDFKWAYNCKMFEKYNFFYGWNYSGKTILSRIFACLELKMIHEDFQDCEFVLETSEGNITHKDIFQDYPIRVFNEDFIKTNFQWNVEDAKISPVLILGKEAKELKDELDELIKQKKKNIEERKQVVENKKKMKNSLDKNLTNEATNIRENLKITNVKELDRTKLEEKINNMKNSYKNFILTVKNKEDTRDFYESKKLEKINLEFPHLKLLSFIGEVENILFKKVSSKQIIEKLKANPKLSNWVKEGIEMHQNEKNCQFCGNQLPLDLFEKLNTHFSEEFNELMQQIKDKESDIQIHIDEITNLKIIDSARLFEDLQIIYNQKIKSLKSEKNIYIQTLEDLKKELNKKREKPFESVEIKETVNGVCNQLLNKLFNEIKKIFNDHDSRIDTYENKKLKAKEKLVNHYSAETIKKIDYFNSIEETNGLRDTIDSLNSEIEALDDEIRNIEAEIKKETIGAERINEYLRLFFNDDRLRIEIVDGDKYKLYRDNRIAKNLSTGEKNIISLIYFFAKLEETGFDFDNSIIFIDDPVSSLDSNHIFRVYGFINEKLKNCGQLFITTHNFDFFNLLKDFNEKEKNYYLVKKIANQSKKHSCIEDLPKILCKFKSEYNYLFSIIKSFNDSKDKLEFEMLYILPNILRRFFEAYLYMKYPDGERFKTKAKKFLRNCNESDMCSVLKLIDEYSHEQNPEHSLKFPDIEELENAISFILNKIEKKDPEHYHALCGLSK